MISERWWRRAALWVVAATALSVAGLRPAHAVSTTVVISQVYGAGGNSGAVLQNDFIELYNRGTTPQDLSGWAVQYASATSKASTNLWQATPLGSVVLQPGHYFLVAEVQGSTTVGAPLPVTPDVQGAINLSGSAGKVALTNSTSLLTFPVGGTTGAPTDASTIVDYVGYGTTVNYTEPFGGALAAAPAPSATLAILRNGNPRGVQDTDNNTADFSTGTPDPRNSAYGATATGPSVSNVIVNPTSADPGTTGVTISATVAAGTNGAVATTTVDLTPVGGSAIAPMTNNSGTWSATFNVALSATAGVKSLVVTATDSGSPAKTGTGAGSFTVQSIVPPITVAAARAQGAGAATVTVRGVVTSNTSGSGQVYISDADGGAGLQVYKSGLTEPISTIIDVTGTLSVYRGELELAATLITPRGTSTPVAPTVVTLPQMLTIGPAPAYAHPNEGRLLTVQNVTVTKASSTTTASGVTYNIADDSGNSAVVYVPAQATASSLANPIVVGTIQVGYVYTLTGNQSYFGAASGEVGDNPTLFELKPRDANDVVTIGQALIQSVTADPSAVARGSSTTITAILSQTSGATVKADLTGFGGSATQSFTDNGGGTFTLTVPVSGSQPYGPVTVTVTATYGTSTLAVPLTITVVTPLVEVTNIAQARGVADYTQVHISTGVATAVGTTGAGQTYIQDSSGGVYLFNNTTAVSANIGETIDAVGYKLTFNGGVEIFWDYNGGSATSTGNGTAPTPAVVTTAQWSGKPGQLVVNNNLYVISGTSTSGTASFTVSDGTSVGQLFVHTNAKLTTYPVAGSTYNVTGIADYYKAATTDAWQLKVRGQSDLVLVGTTPPAAAIPTKLAFTTPPAGAAPGAVFTTQPVVTVQTATGTTANAYVGPVNLTIKSGTGTTGAVLSGTATVNAVNGVATFSGLSIDLAGTGYVLTATSTGGVGASLLTTADSDAFTVAQTVVPGDIDKSGTVDAADAVLALKVYSGLVDASDPSVSVANGDVAPKGALDGKIDLTDVIRIIRSVNNLDTLP